MINFEHKLPSMNIEGRHNGTYNNHELGFPSILTTRDAKLGLFLKALRNSILSERSLVFIDGKILLCDKNWIRDHVHITKAMRHWEQRFGDFLDFIIATQREDGQFYELIKQYDDEHWKMVNEDCYVLYPDDNLTLVRLELEADIEYLVVEGAMYLYRTTGDDEWLSNVLPALEKGIDYMMSDEKRFDKEHGLVKRPFTIDTWDFTYDPTNNTKGAEDRRINPDTPMSIMHGDNSGVYQAMMQLAWFNRRLGNEDKAKNWEERAAVLKENMFKHLWNGKFFMHQLHLGHNGADNLENERLSLSNAYDMNRGVTDLWQSRSIIEEYINRGKKSKLFAEWFTIDPPYENFIGYTAGEYVNGAVSPFTAGELAKAAFNNGYESYGYDIIKRFMKLVERDGTSYFLYYPDSAPQADRGPSAWGAAALISAVDEGLAGIEDIGVNYDEIRLSPRFTVTEYDELRYLTGYECSNTLVDLRFIIKKEGMRYDLYSPAKTVHAHILLPEGKTAKTLYINGKQTAFTPCRVADSNYVDVCVESDGYISFEIIF